MRRQVRAGRAGRGAAGSRRSSGRSRTCRWCRRRGSTERALGVVERGHQPPHAVEPEPHPEQLERQQVALGLLGRSSRLRVTAPRAPLRSRASLSRSACNHVRRRLGDESLVGELALGALDLGLELGSPGSAACVGGLEVELVARRGSRCPARDGDRGRRGSGRRRRPATAAPSRASVLVGLARSRRRPAARGRVAPALTAAESRHARSACTASIIRPSDASARSSSSSGATGDAGGEQPSAPGT